MLKRIALISFLFIILILYFAYLPGTLKTNVSFGELRVSYKNLIGDSRKQVECLADNIFFESAYEPKRGQIAVAFVTLNRVYSGNYPNTVCGVVKQKDSVVCQFSWYCQERERRLSYSKDLTPKQKEVYNEIRELATHVYVNYEKMKDPTNGALFYHADYVNPGWIGLIKTVVIGRHIFYTRKGTT